MEHLVITVLVWAAFWGVVVFLLVKVRDLGLEFAPPEEDDWMHDVSYSDLPGNIYYSGE